MHARRISAVRSSVRPAQDSERSIFMAGRKGARRWLHFVTQKASCSFPSVIWCFGRFCSCCLARSVERFQEVGDRRASARTRYPTATDPPSGVDVDRPALPRGGQPVPTALTLAVLHRDAGDAAALASALGGEAMDVRAASRAPADSPGDPSAGAPVARDNPRWGYQRIVGELKGVPTNKSVSIAAVEVTADRGYACRNMIAVLLALLLTLRRSVRSHAAIQREVLALRHHCRCCSARALDG
jgi:hypothetical protein